MPVKQPRGASVRVSEIHNAELVLIGAKQGLTAGQLLERILDRELPIEHERVLNAEYRVVVENALNRRAIVPTRHEFDKDRRRPNQACPPAFRT